ncbi:MAG: tetratricopeptide repeat protein, partial [Proteobacteria bacterium]|nr:tetratricopeptide repeat protein [Pseudomonadota bacterium]
MEREEYLKFEEAARPFRELDDPARSFEMLDAFLAMHPDSPYADEAILEQARIRAGQGEWEEARNLLENLLEDYPTASARGAALIELAQTCKDAERWKDCV